MKRFYRTATLLTVVASFFAGCQTSGPIVRNDSPGDVYVQAHVGVGLVIDGMFNADGTLDRPESLGQSFRGTDVRLLDLRSVPSEAGFVQVQATVENTSRSRERIEFRYRWIDPNGMEIAQGSSGWRSETLESREQRALTGVARSPDVRAFQLFVRTYEPRK